MPAIQVPIAIDRGSPVPLYHQLTQQLRAAITDGRLQPGDPFENEMAMAQRLSLSRPTVRHAIQEMVDQGLLVRRRGLGTTVASPRIHRRAELTSLNDDLQRDGRSPTTRVLSLEIGEFPEVSTALDLPPETPLTAMTRLRLADESPLAILHNWLPPACGEVTADELEGKGLYALLRERGIRPMVAQQSLGARMPTAGERRDLRLRGTQPVLTMTRVAFDAAGSPVEYGDHCYRAEDYRLDFVIDQR